MRAMTSCLIKKLILFQNKVITFSQLHKITKSHFFITKLTVSLKRNLRIFLIFFHRHQWPSKCVCIKHVNIHWSTNSIVFTGTVASKRVNVLSNCNWRMINSSWSWERKYKYYNWHFASLKQSIFSHIYADLAKDMEM